MGITAALRIHPVDMHGITIILTMSPQHCTVTPITRVLIPLLQLSPFKELNIEHLLTPVYNARVAQWIMAGLACLLGTQWDLEQLDSWQ